MADHRPSLLERLGLHRPALRAWAMYDWANSAFFLVVITAIYPIFFQQVAAVGLEVNTATFWHSVSTTAGLATVALISPILGAFADFLAWRKRLLALFVGLGAASTAAMFFIQQGNWPLAAVLFALGNIGVATSFVFYDSLLPHIAASDEMDRVSTAAYSLGYLGSSLLLILNIMMIQNPARFGISDAGTATRLAFVGVAVWWVVFSLPLFRRVPEPPRQIETDEHRGANVVRVALSRLGETFKELKGSYRQAFLMLLAMLIYNDGIGTIIRMASIYAVSQSIPQDKIILAILLLQFVGIPFALLFGMLANKIGAKRSILLALAVYVVICFLAFNMDTVPEFYILALMVGMVQGGAQALSRSLFASMIPRHKAAEFFGFFSVFEKFAGLFGPLLFGLMVALTGSARTAILSVIVFFLVGGAILWYVDVEAGRREAQEADARLQIVPT